MRKFRVNDILDIGALASGKMPDLYWELDLTGSELRIVRYVWDNVLRLYLTVRCYPRGSDGSPRYWRDKEDMASDVGVSCPTFRNSVRHMAELGVLTSMDRDEDGTNCYCIGLAPDLINDIIKIRSDKNSSITSESGLPVVYSRLFSTLYNRVTSRQVEYEVSQYLNDNSSTTVKQTQTGSPETHRDHITCSQSRDHMKMKGNRRQNKSLHTHDQDHTHLEVIPPQESAPIARSNEPSHTYRQPIVSSPRVHRVVDAANRYLASLEYVKTPYESEVLKLVSYYEFRSRQVLGTSGFRALPRDFSKSRNWKYFTRMYDLTKQRGWDYRLYIDSQFDRVKYWPNVHTSRPFPNQMLSDKAQSYFCRWLRDYADSYSLDGTARPKAARVVNFGEQIRDEISQSCKRLSDWMRLTGKRRSYKQLTPGYHKLMYFQDHWAVMSPFYLATIPWIDQLLAMQGPNNRQAVDLCRRVQEVRSRPTQYRKALTIVREIEDDMGIPELPDPSTDSPYVSSVA